MLENRLQSFSNYQYKNIVQLHRYKHQQDNLGDGEVIISEDFSENYSLKHQNEMMSAHWSQEQVSFFCVTVNYNKNKVKKHQHYVLCSNDLGHDKESIYFYNKYIIDDLKKKTLQFIKFIIGLMDHLANLRTISFSQTSCFMSRVFKQKLNWNFFATDHRKGENDGDVKNVFVTSGCHKQVVTSCDEFVSVGNKKFPDFLIPFFLKESVRFLTFLSQRHQ